MAQDQAPEILQFSINQGQVDLAPARFAIVDPALHRSWRDLGYLLLAIDALDADLPDEICDQVFRAMTETYYREAASSVTRAVHAAVGAGNQVLFEHNVRADAQHTVSVGLNCASVRGLDAYAAQYGPALTVYIHDGQIAYSPSDSPWLTKETAESPAVSSSAMCGVNRRIEPQIFHVPLQPGDTLILGSTSMIRSANQRSLAAAIRSAKGLGWETAVGSITGEEVVGGALYHVPETAVAVEPVEQPAKVTAPPKSVAPTTPPAQATPSARPPAAKPTVKPAPSEEPFRPEPETAVAASAPKRPKVSLPKPSVDLGRIGRRVGKGASTALDKASGALLETLPQQLPERPIVEDRRGRTAVRLANRVLIGLAIAIPLVMLALIIAFRVQAGRLESQYIRDVYTRAANAWDSAQASEEQTVTRRLLLECLDATEEGLAFDPEHTGLADLTSRATRRLDEIDRVERLYHVWQLAEIPGAMEAPLDSARIVLNENQVYVLDRGADRVCRYELNEVGDALRDGATDPVMLKPGDELGGVVLGDVVDIAWIESGGVRRQSVFAALERSGSLIAFMPQTGITLQPVANSDAWLGPVAMGAYVGNLYILDPLMGRILKYVPVDDAYTTPPTDYLETYQGVDLTGAVDMAVDGNMYVLYADGTVQKYLAGEPQPFSMRGLPDAMDSPRAIFVSGPQEPDAPGFVYVADTGNQRILQFDKQGTFLRQFRASAGQQVLRDLQGLYVDEETGRLFIVSGRTLLLTAFTPYPTS
ncbi:MAG: hypothetical protein ACOX2R_04580 [Anaerolineae bacterium]|jgi:hypothetical protein